MMMQNRTQQRSRPASQVAAHAPNYLPNGQTSTRQRVHVRARRCHLENVAVTVKFRLRRVARAGLQKIVVALHALAVKKRWARVVAKKKMALLQPRRAGALLTEMAHRVVVRADGGATPGAVTRVVAMLVAVHDSVTPAQAAREQRAAHHAAVVAMAATRPRAVQATAVAVMTAAAVVAAAVLATQAGVATTGAAQGEGKAVDMVAATKVVVQAPVHRARAGVIAANRPTDEAVEAREVVVMAAATLAVQAAATGIAAVAGVAAVAGSQATVGRHRQAEASALAAARAIATA